MKIKNSILKTFLALVILLFPSVSSKEIRLDSKNNLKILELMQKEKEVKIDKEVIYYFSPFQDIKEDYLHPKEDSSKAEINLKAEKILESILFEAEKMYEKEKIRQEKRIQN